MRAKGLNVVGRWCDVTRHDAQQSLVDETIGLFGGLDIVVANAGVPGPMGGTLGTSDEAYETVMRVNLSSVFQLCRLTIPHLKARGGGSFILMASLAGLRGNKGLGAYALSKAALSQLARNIAVEHGPDNIRANAIAPGLIRTALSEPLLADQVFMAKRLAMTPLRRIGEPEEVAAAAHFLAATSAAFITGQTLTIDGGTLVTDGS
jgi:NAD(P)-dependent dehydrogenase (short-subunit alcohol dehydrogenase family)